MDVGLFVPIGSANATPELVRAVGREAEERGFESIWVAEHVVLFDEYDSAYPYDPSGRFPAGGDAGMVEPFTALTYLAAVTERIRLGTGICLVPQRNPVYTAKAVTDLDALSGGRVDFGVGVGWLREEFEALGMPFDRRGQRADEYLAACAACGATRCPSTTASCTTCDRAGCTPSRYSARTRASTWGARATPPCAA